MLNLIHVTHEAVHKVGGIGAVLEGLITSAAYAEAVDRTLLLCPLFTTDGDVGSRLGPDGDVLYSSVDGRFDHPFADAFGQVRKQFGVEIVYGRRVFRDLLSGDAQRAEVALIDVRHMVQAEINKLKFRLNEAFGLDSTRYESDWDYEMYLRLAEPGLAVARAVGLQAEDRDCVVVSHEFMGMATALAAKLHAEWDLKTAYHAHEVSTARKIVEHHSGHDTMFYNVLAKCAEQGLSLDDVFGDQTGYYRHALTEASRHLDVTLAVGDYVVDELRALSPEMADSNIRLCYNGIPAHAMESADQSKGRLQDYAEILLGDRPDYVFTHVTRLVPSKGLWRDILVMHAIERELRKSGETAVLFVLSTEIGGPRPRKDILHMEHWWDWPVSHRESLPDLSDGEALFYQGVQGFNARSCNCKIVFINQFGFDRATCGDRMPAEMEFWDIRKGSDVEFGQSVYEPFGIAQLEALSFGAICVMSSVCGCRFFAEKAAGGADCPNLIVADYTDYQATPDTIEAYLECSREQRERFDAQVAERVARQVLDRLPRTAEQKAALIRRGYEMAARMSWDVVTRDYFLPALHQICTSQRAADLQAARR